LRARSPGKIVISGAYAVLEGAPAIVSAVDRYAIADATRPAELVTPEVRAAIGDRRAPWFDASALRGEKGKLGLGSSAAILVASLAALELVSGGAKTHDLLARAVFEPALAAHRAAQGGGSGIDVAASTFGGTLIAQRNASELVVENAELPPDLSLQVWFAGEPASTAELVGRVTAFRQRDAASHTRVMTLLGQAAERAARALRARDPALFIDALGEQAAGLAELGRGAGAPIVTPELEQISERARQEGIVVLPSGAGGGDVALAAGRHAPSPELVALFARFGHIQLPLGLSARGVHAFDSDPS
jgi:phosphomevalonate kinase